MTSDLDSLDKTILSIRIQAWNTRSGPRVGDKILMRDGSIRRFAHDYGNELQTTSAKEPGDQRYYLGHGYCSFSGTLGELISKADIEPTDQTGDAPVWFFHHDQARAFNAVQADIPCRLYKQKEAP